MFIYLNTQIDPGNFYLCMMIILSRSESTLGTEAISIFLLLAHHCIEDKLRDVCPRLNTEYEAQCVFDYSFDDHAFVHSEYAPCTTNCRKLPVTMTKGYRGPSIGTITSPIGYTYYY